VHWALINAGRGFACWSQRSVAFNTARGGSHVALRVDDARVGRELLRRLTPHVDSAANWWRPASAWMSIAISYAGFEALGLPQNSLASFPEAFCVGMAARAQQLRDLGVNCLDYVVVLASDTFATCSNRTRDITTKLVRTYRWTRMRRFRGRLRLMAASLPSRI
jgi:deferrochelatase/peroxidase EfeB